MKLRGLLFLMVCLGASCGGNVVVDPSATGTGGAGGAAGTSGMGVSGVGTSGVGSTSSSASSASSAGGPLGCTKSDPPPGASIGIFNGGLAIPGGLVTYGGMAAPKQSTTADALVITEDFVETPTPQYPGVVLYFFGNAAGTHCVDASTYTGVQFDISGTVSGETAGTPTNCTVQFGIDDAEHTDATLGDPVASGPAGSYPPQLTLSASQITSTLHVVKVPFAGPGAPTIAGSPASAIDPTRLTAIQWGYTIPAAVSEACVSSLTITNIAFYY